MCTDGRKQVNKSKNYSMNCKENKCENSEKDYLGNLLSIF